MITAKVIAACFALAGFAATAIAGVFVDNPATITIVRALVVMFAAWMVGFAVGLVLQKTTQRHVDQYKQEHPLPDVEAAASGEGADGSHPSDSPSSQAAATG